MSTRFKKKAPMPEPVYDEQTMITQTATRAHCRPAMGVLEGDEFYEEGDWSDEFEGDEPIGPVEQRHSHGSNGASSGFEESDEDDDYEKPNITDDDESIGVRSIEVIPAPPLTIGRGRQGSTVDRFRKNQSIARTQDSSPPPPLPGGRRKVSLPSSEQDHNAPMAPPRRKGAEPMLTNRGRAAHASTRPPAELPPRKTSIPTAELPPRKTSIPTDLPPRGTAVQHDIIEPESMSEPVPARHTHNMRDRPPEPLPTMQDIPAQPAPDVPILPRGGRRPAPVEPIRSRQDELPPVPAPASTGPPLPRREMNSSAPPVPPNQGRAPVVQKLLNISNGRKQPNRPTPSMASTHSSGSSGRSSCETEEDAVLQIYEEPDEELIAAPPLTGRRPAGGVRPPAELPASLPPSHHHTTPTAAASSTSPPAGLPKGAVPLFGDTNFGGGTVTEQRNKLRAPLLPAMNGAARAADGSNTNHEPPTLRKPSTDDVKSITQQFEKSQQQSSTSSEEKKHQKYKVPERSGSDVTAAGGRKASLPTTTTNNNVPLRSSSDAGPSTNQKRPLPQLPPDTGPPPAQTAPPPAPEVTPARKVSTSSNTSNRLSSNVREYSWYYDDCTRDMTVAYLEGCESGTFIVRKKNDTSKPYVLSLTYNRRLWHLFIRKRSSDRKYALGNYKEDERTFDHVPQMISFYQNSELLLNGDHGGEVVLTTHPPQM